MKTDELRQLSDEELRARAAELKDELFRMRLQKASGQLEKTHLFKQHRREIARCLTILTERQMTADQQKTAETGK